MPFTNFDSRNFSSAEKTAVTTALTTLENALATKTAELTPEERQQYGSINETNKLVVNKVKEYRDGQPGLSSPEVDWTEFMSDYDTRVFIQATILRLQGLEAGLDNAKILHDHDNYQAALIDYNYAKYKAASNTPNYSVKVSEIGQFFTGATKKNGSTANASES